MTTKKVKVDPQKPEEKVLEEAAKVIKEGGLVIIPTETVYGLCADMSNEKAVVRLYEIKKRPLDKPFSLHISSKNKLEEVARALPIAAYKLMDKFWPGPLTLILKSVSQGTIGVRFPSDLVAQRIIHLSGAPVVCPSANLTDNDAPVNFEQAVKDLDGLVDYALDAGPARLGVESTIVDCVQEPPKIIREGAIKKEDIEAVLSKKTVLFVCTGNSCRSVMAEALLKKKLKEKNRSDVEVLSAGVMLTGGLAPTYETQEVLRKEGIDVSTHRSQGISKEMVKKSDLILVMEKAQGDRILQIAPEIKNRVFLLKEFAKIKDSRPDIEDPIGKSLDFYEKTSLIIKNAIERIVEII